MSREKVLFVDDEPNLLEGIRNQLRKLFDVRTAPGGDEALAMLEKEPEPFSVIVSDMRMPKMNGAQFLATVRQKWPDTVRMLLTGNSDMEDAIRAVNEGNIFRFLTKPCPPEVLKNALDAAFEQARLIKAEQELLEKTVKGCVQVLTDMLALANPFAMNRTTRIQHYVRQIAKALGLDKIWQLEIAAMLSQVGCAAIPVETMRRAETHASTLSPESLSMVRSHPRVAHDLIATIPRLEFVAEIVARQNDPFKKEAAGSSGDGAVIMGASILRAAVDLDSLLLKTRSLDEAVNAMELRLRNSGEYNPVVVRVLRGIQPFERTAEMEVRRLADLENGMILARDIRTLSGALLLSEGHQLNAFTRIHLRNQMANAAVKDEFYVWKRR